MKNVPSLMRVFRLVIVALSLAGCAATQPRAGDVAAAIGRPAAEQQVIAVAEALFSAMQTRDTAAIRALFVPETQIVAIRVGGASTAEPQRRSVSEFITSIARPGDELRERMRDPQVEADADFATLWAPYDLHIGDRFSHCGYDAFDLVRRNGRWKIVALTYTIQPAGCTAGGTPGP